MAVAGDDGLELHCHYGSLHLVVIKGLDGNTTPDDDFEGIIGIVKCLLVGTFRGVDVLQVKVEGMVRDANAFH